MNTAALPAACAGIRQRRLTAVARQQVEEEGSVRTESQASAVAAQPVAVGSTAAEGAAHVGPTKTDPGGLAEDARETAEHQAAQSPAPPRPNVIVDLSLLFGEMLRGRKGWPIIRIGIAIVVCLICN